MMIDDPGSQELTRGRCDSSNSSLKLLCTPDDGDASKGPNGPDILSLSEDDDDSVMSPPPESFNSTPTKKPPLAPRAVGSLARSSAPLIAGAFSEPPPDQVSRYMAIGADGITEHSSMSGIHSVQAPASAHARLAASVSCVSLRPGAEDAHAASGSMAAAAGAAAAGAATFHSLTEAVAGSGPKISKTTSAVSLHASAFCTPRTFLQPLGEHGWVAGVPFLHPPSHPWSCAHAWRADAWSAHHAARMHGNMIRRFCTKREPTTAC